jgi:3'(2'), 5'-bisphosphate nucleotidase
MFLPSSHQREWQVALTAVREAGTLCQALQGEPLARREKPDGSPVTAADFAAQALICSTLAGTFPDDPIVAEEDSAILRARSGAALLEEVTSYLQRFRPGVTPSDVCQWIDHGAHRSGLRFWALDPLDGSKGFLRGHQYAIALALIEGGQVKLAVLACPNLRQLERWPHQGVLLAAAEGQGAWALGVDELATASRLSVSTIAEPGLASACESFESAHTNHGAGSAVASVLGLTTPPLRLDSQVKYALVAGGSVEAYFRIPPNADAIENIWDHAAGSLLVVEAGGSVTDLDGRPLEFSNNSRRPPRGVAVTNGILHGPILEAFRSLGLTP